MRKILQYHQTMFNVNYAVVFFNHGLHLIEATCDGVDCRLVAGNPGQPIKNYTYLPSGRWAVEFNNSVTFLRTSVTGNARIVRVGLDNDLDLLIAADLSFYPVFYLREMRHYFVSVSSQEVLEILQSCMLDRCYSDGITERLIKLTHGEDYFTMDLYPWGTIVAPRLKGIHGFLSRVNPLDLRLVQGYDNSRLGITFNYHPEGKAIISYRRYLSSAKVVDFSLPTDLEERDICKEWYVLFHLYPHVDMRQITKYKKGNVVTYIDNVTRYYLTLAKIGDSFYEYEGKVGFCVAEASESLARTILRSSLQEINKKIKKDQAVREIRSLTADEIIKKVRRIDKFYMSDSTAVGNCVYGTRMWLKSIGLCPDADHISGQELAAALEQHRDKAKDPNFLRVLASKI